MWIPKTEDEIVQAISSGSLVESPTFDAKRELPASGKSKDLAKDVAAMATDGGTLLYGIAEDGTGRPTIPAPFPLDGIAERVASIVRSGISEPPEIFVLTIPTAADSTVGYLVVSVPPSSRAPHMVTIDKDFRYYGRGANGNVVLTEGEIARLYERRKRWETDQDAILNDLVRQAPVATHDNFSYLHLLVQPIGTGEDLLQRGRKTLSEPDFLNTLLSSTLQLSVFPPSRFDPDFTERVLWYRQPDGWEAFLKDDPRFVEQRDPSNILDIRVNFNGSGYLFCGRLAERHESNLLFFEQILAGLTSRCLWFFGQLYKQANYLGPVDIGFAATGLKGAIPCSATRMAIFGAHFRLFERTEYRRVERVFASSLETNTRDMVKQLVMPLINAFTQGNYDPFK